jgi:hypothetical protein
MLYTDVIKTDAKGNEFLQLHEPQLDGPQLRVLGKTRLGYRQMNAERWVAAPSAARANSSASQLLTAKKPACYCAFAWRVPTQTAVTPRSSLKR